MPLCPPVSLALVLYLMPQLEHTCEAGTFYLVISNFSLPELPPDEGAKLGGERVGVEAIVSL